MRDGTKERGNGMDTKEKVVTEMCRSLEYNGNSSLLFFFIEGSGGGQGERSQKSCYSCIKKSIIYLVIGNISLYSFC